MDDRDDDRDLELEEAEQDPEWIEDEEQIAFEEATCIGLSPGDMALRVRWASGIHQWVPRSVVVSDSAVYEPGDTGTLTLRLWWWEKSGRDEYEQIRHDSGRAEVLAGKRDAALDALRALIDEIGIAHSAGQNPEAVATMARELSILNREVRSGSAVRVRESAQRLGEIEVGPGSRLEALAVLAATAADAYAQARENAPS